MNQPFQIRLNGPITNVERNIHGTAAQLAEAGATLAADHASRLTNTDWHSIAYAFLRDFASTREQFHCSELREGSKGVVPDHPNLDPRAWGAVVKRAAKDGIIVPLGYGRTERKMSHGRAEQTWAFLNGNRLSTNHPLP